MATYIKTLSDRDGNVILPKTRSSCVSMSDNSTLEDKISFIINTKSANGHTHKPDEAHPANATTKLSGDNNTNYIGKYTEVMSFTSTGSYGGVNIAFMVRESNNGVGFAIMNLAFRATADNTDNDFCYFHCIATDSVGATSIAPRFKVYYSNSTYRLYYIPDRLWMVMSIHLISARIHLGSITWRSNQLYFATGTGKLVATSKNSYPITNFSTTIPKTLDDGAICLVYQ